MWTSLSRPAASRRAVCRVSLRCTRAASVSCDPTVSGWNTFRLIFDRYFGESYPLLPDLSYTSATYLRPYDLTDITGRLSTLNGGAAPAQTIPAPIYDPGTSGRGAKCDSRGMSMQSGC